MLCMQTISKVKRLYHKEGLSQRSIAQKLNLNRRTVNKYLNTTEPPSYKRPDQNHPKLGEFIPLLEQRLIEESLLPAKQRLTAQRHFEWLKTKGFDGSYTTITDFIRKFKDRYTPEHKEAFLPLYFPPADTYQFDWSTEYVKISGQLTKLKIAQFRLYHSRAIFLIAYPNET